MVFTVQPGHKAARPLIFRPSFGRNPWAVWRIRLVHGWGYILPENQTQWVKLCGLAFGVSSNKNTILLGARHLPGVGIQISPYYNVRGEQWYLESKETPTHYRPDWPYIPLSINYAITFGIRVSGTEVTTTMINDGMRKVHRIDHEGLCPFYREVNFYFGGSVAASEEIALKKDRLDYMKISPDDGGLILT